MTFNRRTFLICATAATLPMAANAAPRAERYSPGVIKKHLAAGRTVFIEFTTDWCSTCASQKRKINALRDKDPAYDAAMVFVEVDWDEYAFSAIANRYGVGRRSTLVVVRGDITLGKVVAKTSVKDIKALMDLGLARS